MTWRSILVHLDGSPRCAERVALAGRLAREHAAHVFGLAPAGVVHVPMRVSSSLTGVDNFAEIAQKNLNERAAAWVRDFERRLGDLGVASFEGRVASDHGIEALVRHACTHDLVVLGQTDPASTSKRLDVDIAEQVFMSSGVPALIVPHAGSFDAVGRRVVVAWNATREAALAVRGALPLLRAAQRVHLVCLDVSSDPRRLTRSQLDDACRWLERHGVEVQTHRESVREPVGDALLARSREFGADLIVMGGYGHSRAAEFLLGGVTRDLLRGMTLPLLLAH